MFITDDINFLTVKINRNSKNYFVLLICTFLKLMYNLFLIVIPKYL